MVRVKTIQILLLKLYVFRFVNLEPNQEFVYLPSVQLDETFLLIGGFGSTTIFEYNQSEEKFVERPEQLPEGRSFHGALILNDICGNN